MLTSVQLEKVQKFTKTSIPRLDALADCLHKIDMAGIAGDIVECGVWRGGSIILSRIISPNRMCWLFDTFEGMTAPGPNDKKKSGRPASEILAIKKKAMSCATLDEVVENLKATGTYDERFLRFVKGPVEQTLQYPINIPPAIALLRLDTDWYESTKIELERLWPMVSDGGYLIVDDFGHWMGSNKAVRDYFGHNFSYSHIDYSAIVMRK